MYSVISVEIPISDITITREQSSNFKIRLCEGLGNLPRNAPWVKFSPKLEFCVNTSKVGKKLAYWPIASLLFILFKHFFRVKSMKITVIFHKNEFQRFTKYRIVLKIWKIGY